MKIFKRDILSINKSDQNLLYFRFRKRLNKNNNNNYSLLNHDEIVDSFNNQRNKEKILFSGSSDYLFLHKFK